MFSPDVILCGWLGSKHQLTNLLLCLSFRVIQLVGLDSSNIPLHVFSSAGNSGEPPRRLPVQPQVHGHHDQSVEWGVEGPSQADGPRSLQTRHQCHHGSATWAGRHDYVTLRLGRQTGQLRYVHFSEQVPLLYRLCIRNIPRIALGGCLDSSLKELRTIKEYLFLRNVYRE